MATVICDFAQVELVVFATQGLEMAARAVPF